MFFRKRWNFTDNYEVTYTLITFQSLNLFKSFFKNLSQTPEDCSSKADCLPLVLSWEASGDIQSGDVLLVEIDDKFLISSQQKNLSDEKVYGKLIFIIKIRPWSKLFRPPQDSSQQRSSVPSHPPRPRELRHHRRWTFRHNAVDCRWQEAGDAVRQGPDRRNKPLNRWVTFRRLFSRLSLFVVLMLLCVPFAVVSEKWDQQCVRLRVNVKSDNCGENAECSGKGICFSNTSMVSDYLP